MKNRTASRIALGIALAVAAVSQAYALPDPQIAHLEFTSYGDDFIGLGQSEDRYYSNTPGPQIVSTYIHKYAEDGNPSWVDFALGTSIFPDKSASVDFSTQALGHALQVGYYPEAVNVVYPEELLGLPGMHVWFDNRGANTVVGWYAIDEVSFYTKPNGLKDVSSMSARFQQQVDGQSGGIYGSFSYLNLAVPTTVPEPSSLGFLMLCGPTLAVLVRRRRYT